MDDEERQRCENCIHYQPIDDASGFCDEWGEVRNGWRGGDECEDFE